MSLSTLRLRFLLDENVRFELAEFLNTGVFGVKCLPKGTPDAFLAASSKKEKRILVTNDKDFSQYHSKKIFAVIWLKIPQKDGEALIISFQKLLRECSRFSGQLIVLSRDSWRSFPLPKSRKVER